MSSCHDMNLEVDKKIEDMMNKILLMGNPNVGKSVFFSTLTGMHVMSSNYAGTTVTYTNAKMILGDMECQLIDVPGTYSLSATNEAEQVAVSFMEAGAKAVLCVLDATNLTRNLNLAFEILNKGIPVVFALNLTDIAERKGIEIATQILEKELGAPVIKTVAVKGTGFEELKAELLVAMKGSEPACSGSCSGCQGKKTVAQETMTQKEIWERSEHVAKKCITYTEQNLKFIDRLGEQLLKPWPGVPIALLVMILSLVIVVFGGKGIRAGIFIPLVNVIIDFFKNIIGGFGLPTLIENILIGEYGIFVIGFEWPFALILPYVAVFYIVFTFLEDCGFLPRVAVLFDNVMRKTGTQGGSLISLMMGFGCAVPAIIGTRNATTRKERIVVTAMVCFAVPCISQSGALIGLLGEASMLLLLLVFAVAFVMVLLVGLITGKILKGKVDPIIIEVPNLLMPEKKAYGKKLLIRMKSFLLEAEGPMMIAVVIASVFTEAGLLDAFAAFVEPVVAGMLGLPEEAALFLLLGVIRREMAVAPLLDMELDNLQLLVGGVVALLYVPCLSVLGVIAREFNAKVAVAIGVGTFVTAILAGTIINYIGQFLLMFI